MNQHVPVGFARIRSCLGNAWLQGLGKVLHDWSNITTEFWSKDKKYVLQGENTGRARHGSIQSIQKLLDNGVESYVLTINKSTENNKVNLAQVQTRELKELLQKYQFSTDYFFLESATIQVLLLVTLRQLSKVLLFFEGSLCSN